MTVLWRPPVARTLPQVRIHPRPLLVWTLALLPTLAPAVETLAWDADAATAGANGGTGSWNTTTANWWRTVGSNSPWIDGSHASFGGTAGVVSLGAAITCGDLLFPTTGYRISTGSRLLTITGSTPHAFDFADGTARYTTTPAQIHGLRLLGTAALAARVRGGGQSTVTVDGGTTTFAGSWWKQEVQSDDRGYWRLVNGGRLVVDASAEINTNMADLVNSRYITAVGTDGGGTLDLAEGFQADHMGWTPLSTTFWTNNGMSWLGLSGTVTLITRHTRNLPTVDKLVPVRDSDGTVRTVYDHHGLLTIAPPAGLCDLQPTTHAVRWIVETNPQTYDGGINWTTDWTLETRQDLTFDGIYGKAGYGTYTSGGSVVPWAEPKTALGPRSSTPNTTVTKTGPARLIIAGQQGWTSGSVLRVVAGEVRFETDPALDYLTRFGTGFPSGNVGNHLRLVIDGGSATLAPLASDQFGIFRISLSNGSLAIGAGSLTVAESLSLAAGTVTDITLGAADAGRIKLPVAGTAVLGGTLRITASALPSGDLTLIESTGGISGTFAATQLPPGRSLVYTANTVKLVPTNTNRAPTIVTSAKASPETLVVP